MMTFHVNHTPLGTPGGVYYNHGQYGILCDVRNRHRGKQLRLGRVQLR